MYAHVYQYIAVCKHTQYWINTSKYILLNVHNFKTKPPFDKWSIPYERGLQNIASFVENESSAVCRSFSEKPWWKLSQNRKKYNIYELQKIKIINEQRDSFKYL